MKKKVTNAFRVALDLSEQISAMGGKVTCKLGFHEQPDRTRELGLDAENPEVIFHLTENEKAKVTLSAEGHEDWVQRFGYLEGDIVELPAPTTA